MEILKKWYAGRRKPRDERITQEVNRIYRIGYWVFNWVLGLDIVYKALFTDLPADSWRNEWWIIIGVNLVMVVLMSRKGICSELPDEAEVFPYWQNLVRCLAPAICVGGLVVLKGLTYGWFTRSTTDALICLLGALLAACVTYGLCLVACYLVFVWARAARRRAEQETDDES